MFRYTNEIGKRFIKMIVKNNFSDILQIQDVVHDDQRGFFSEIYNQNYFLNLGVKDKFIQDNLSYSQKRGTLRGLHYQIDPYSQSKLLRVMKGKIIDCFVDLRIGSKTFEKHYLIELDAKSGWVYIPKGFAHGFCTLEDETIVMYKVDEYYSKEDDRGVVWNDSTFNIDWPIEDKKLIISEKDRNLPEWKKLKIENKFYYGK